MKNNVLRASVLAAGLCLMSAPVVAHHGDAGRYDESAFVITGTIVEIRLTNPHSIMVFDVTDADGKTVRWQGEMTGGPAHAYHEIPARRRAGVLGEISGHPQNPGPRVEDRFAIFPAFPQPQECFLGNVHRQVGVHSPRVGQRPHLTAVARV